jgi:hypothetical protein
MCHQFTLICVSLVESNLFATSNSTQMERLMKLKARAEDNAGASSSYQHVQQTTQVVMARAPRWNDIPSQVQEMVLANLPFHVLYRFRLVCRSWNHLLTRLAFASLRTQKTPYVLMSPKLVDFDPFEDSFVNREKGRNWQILDVEEGRFYSFSDSFVDLLPQRNLYRDQYALVFEDLGWLRFTMATDGGLIYAMYGSSRNGVQRHTICDPARKSFHHIMDPDLDFDYDNIVVMSVDDANNSYTIVVMEAYVRHALREEEVHIYQS